MSEFRRSPSDYKPELAIGLGGVTLAAGGALCGLTYEAGFVGAVFGGVTAITGEIMLGKPVRRGAKKAWDTMLDKTEATVVRTARVVLHPVKTSRSAWTAVANKVEDIRLAHNSRWQPAYAPHMEQRTRMLVTGRDIHAINASLIVRR